jgi:hypothetical protein
MLVFKHGKHIKALKYLKNKQQDGLNMKINFYFHICLLAFLKDLKTKNYLQTTTTIQTLKEIPSKTSSNASNFIFFQ